MKNKLVIMLIIAFAVLGALGIYYFFGKSEVEPTNNKFSDEYTLVGEDNVFVTKTASEIIDVLENGTGIVFFGFPECPWCQHYVQYLNEAAKNNKVKEIYYYNIKEDRANNTKNYQKIVSILKDKLLTDDSGNPRIYVPDVTFNI